MWKCKDVEMRKLRLKSRLGGYCLPINHLEMQKLIFKFSDLHIFKFAFREFSQKTVNCLPIRCLVGLIFYFYTMNQFRYYIEWHLFGVCTAIGERLGIATSRIRTWFVYISFLTMGSPLIIYFVLAFLMNIKRYILSFRRNPVKYQ